MIDAIFSYVRMVILYDEVLEISMHSVVLITKIYKYKIVYILYMFFRKRRDPKLKNVSKISEKIKEKYKPE